MHGRPREYKNKLKDPKAQESYKKKVDAIKAGTALILQCRQQKRYDEVVLAASAKLLKVVPEIYTIWNFRREALSQVLAAGGPEAKQASSAELALTQACLMENPKSYSTWHHRKWIVAHGLCDLEAELTLVSRALDEDSRNFHAWNYRQFLVRRMARSLSLELEYSELKIAQDFSNYSAWHYRTILLPAIHCKSPTQANLPMQADTPSQVLVEEAGPGAAGGSAHQQLISSTPGLSLGSASQIRPIPVQVLDEEYDMVHQAFATDSKDQSPWMYYRWLVGNSIAHVEAAGHELEGPAREEAVAAAKQQLGKVLAREVERLEVDHLASEPDARWPLLTLARLKEAQVRHGVCGDGDLGTIQTQVAEIYSRLKELDHMRSGYYQDALEGKAFVVVSALGTV